MQNDVKSKMGIVLSGGGGKGAYEVGALQAVTEAGMYPEVISGASIGALNGVLFASAQTPEIGVQELLCLWGNLNPEQVLKVGVSRTRVWAMALLRQALLRLYGLPVAFAGELAEYIRGMLSENDREMIGLLDSSPIEDILSETVDLDHLASGGIETWISVYPSSFGGKGLRSIVSDLFRYNCSRDKSEFLRLQDLDKSQMIRAVLASAAIPLAFKPLEVGGQVYRDGGMGDKLTAQGNTPIEPLVKSGCTHAVVIVISDGVLWNRYEWPDIEVLEIRPSEPIGDMMAALNFDPVRIKELVTLGYADAKRSIAKIRGALSAFHGLQSASADLDVAIRNLEAGNGAFDSASRELDGLLGDKVARRQISGTNAAPLGERAPGGQ